MKKKFTFLVFGLSLLFTSCSHLYEPAFYRQDIAYQPKPASFDSVKAQTYISAGYKFNTNSVFDDYLNSGQLNVSRGYVFDGFNVAYGAFGVIGDYERDNNPAKAADNFSDKYFGGFGGRASINLFKNTDDVDFRFIGVEMAYSHEFGDYASFRRYLNTLPGYFVDPRTDLFTVGLTTEVIFRDKNNPDFQHGFRLFLGSTIGNNLWDRTYGSDETPINQFAENVFPKFSYYIKYKKFFGTLEAGNEFFIRFGYAF